MRSPFSNRSGFQIKLIALAFSTAGASSFLPSQMAYAQDQVSAKTHEVNIKANSLSAALNRLGSQAGVALSYDPSLTAGKSAIAINGTYTLQQVLQQLLAGTGLVASQQDDGYVIKAASVDQGLMTLSPVQVEGSAYRNSTEGTGQYSTRLLNTGTGLGISAQETPQSITVITSQRIEDQSLVSLTDVVNSTTGISSKASDSSRDRYSARGFSIDSYQVDGVPIQWQGGWSAGETQTDTALYERVEVVRGATGLLTGAGNPSASINLVRKHAESKEFVGDISLGAGSWDTYNGSIDLSSALNSTGSVRGRVVASLEDAGSYVDLAKNKKSVFYAVIDADLNENTLLSVGASHQKNDPTASMWGGLPIWQSDGTRTNWDRSKTTAASWSRWGSTNDSWFANLSHQFNDDWEARVNVNHAENVGDLHLLYMYGAMDSSTGLGLNASPRRFDTIRKQDDIGLHLTGSYSWLDRKQELAFGATSSKQNHQAYRYQRGAFPAVGNFNQWDGSYAEPSWSARTKSKDITTKQTGYYASTRLALTESLKVILGARSSDWTRIGEENGTRFDYGDKVITPYAGALYDLTDDHTVYLSYTDIFQPQNDKDRTGAFLDPIKGKSYETGLKSGFNEDRLNTTVSFFRIEQDNLAQVDSGFFILGSSPPAQAYRAAKGTVTEGFELEAVGELLPRWNVSVGFTQFSAKDAQGKAVNTDHPNKMLKLFTTYNFNGDLDNLTIGGGVNWEGANHTDTTNPVTNQPEKVEQKSYSLVNLMARYEINDQLSTQVNVDNLFDKTYYSQIGFFSQLAYGQPRSINLDMKYKF